MPPPSCAAKALSTVASTASFDKHPQSRERGITLDLGFSSFTVPVPLHVSGRGFEHVQFTLVDCPGHASLIRTIIGGEVCVCERESQEEQNSAIFSSVANSSEEL